MNINYSFNWGPTPNLGSFFCLPKRTKPRKGQFPVSFSRQVIISPETELFVGSVTSQQMPGLRPLNHPPSLPRKMQRQHCQRFVAFPYCPIGKISVKRRGPRVKRFFVSEAHRAELKNLTEERWSETPGDLPGASFWYFLREKVRRDS